MAKRRVLVVDASQDSADFYAALLSIMGQETRTASNVDEAIQVGGEFRPEVLFMEIRFAIQDFSEVVRRFRGEDWGPGVVLVALPVRVFEEDRRLALEAGFDRCMTSPATPKDFANLLDELERSPEDGETQRGS